MEAFIRSNLALAHTAFALFAAIVFSSLAPRTAGAQAAMTQAEFKWQDLGARTFRANCSICHQDNGQGVAGAFPALAGHVPDMVAQKSGRDYLVRVILFGLQGAIVVNDATFNGTMPPWAQLGDDQIAAVLDHVLTAWGNDKKLPPGFTPIMPSDVATARAERLTGAQVYALRQQTVPGTQTANAPASGPGRQSETSRPAFTTEQAERGEATYRRACQDCHGTELDNGEFGGPPLKGPYFSDHWGAGSVAALYSFTKTKMPPDRPGDLSPQTYVDLTAFILSYNGYKAGEKELSADLDALLQMSLKK